MFQFKSIQIKMIKLVFSSFNDIKNIHIKCFRITFEILKYIQLTICDIAFLMFTVAFGWHILWQLSRCQRKHCVLLFKYEHVGLLSIHAFCCCTRLQCVHRERGKGSHKLQRKTTTYTLIGTENRKKKLLIKLLPAAVGAGTWHF